MHTFSLNTFLVSALVAQTIPSGVASAVPNGFTLEVITDERINTTSVYIANPAVYTVLYNEDIVGHFAAVTASQSVDKLLQRFNVMDSNEVPTDAKFVFLEAEMTSEAYKFSTDEPNHCCYFSSTADTEHEQQQQWRITSSQSTAPSPSMMSFYRRVQRRLTSLNNTAVSKAWSERFFFVASPFKELPTALQQLLSNMSSTSSRAEEGDAVDSSEGESNSNDTAFSAGDYLAARVYTRQDVDVTATTSSTPTQFLPVVSAYQYGIFFPPHGVQSHVKIANPEAACGTFSPSLKDVKGSPQSVLIDVRSPCPNGGGFNFEVLLSAATALGVSAQNPASTLILYGFENDSTDGLWYQQVENDLRAMQYRYGNIDTYTQAVITTTAHGESLVAAAAADGATKTKTTAVVDTTHEDQAPHIAQPVVAETSLFIDYGKVTTPTTGVSIDRYNVPRWLGQYFFPTLQNVGYMPLYQEHLEAIDARVAKLTSQSDPTSTKLEQGGENEKLMMSRGVKIPVFPPGTDVHNTSMGTGPWSAITFPANSTSSGSYPKLYLDVSLGCGDPQSKDYNPHDESLHCPPWDHIIQSYMCCRGAEGDAVLHNNNAKVAAAREQTGERDGPVCDAFNEGQEIGRWMTSYGRGIGRWHTDISPLRPMFTSPAAAAAGGTAATRTHNNAAGTTRCNITAFTVPWVGDTNHKWYIGMNLLLTTEDDDSLSSSRKSSDIHDAAAMAERQHQAGASLRSESNDKEKEKGRTVTPTVAPPELLLDPWPSTSKDTFDVFRFHYLNQSYPSYFPPYGLESGRLASQGYRSGSLVGYMTGHGGDDKDCAEFCSVKHRFMLMVNNSVYKTLWANFTTPITAVEEGCATPAKVRSGVVPNEAGAWYFGRNAWCNGRNVDLWRSEEFGLVPLSSSITNSDVITVHYTALTCFVNVDNCTLYEADVKNSFPAAILFNVYIVLSK